MRERQTERGNEGVCLGEKLTIGGQNSPGLPKSLSLLTITICCYSKCASKLVKSLKDFVQLCWLWVKNLPGHYKKKTVRIVLHKPFFAPLFFRFCLNLNQMLLIRFFYIHANEIKSLWCPTKIKYVLICSVKKILGLHNHLANNPNYNKTRCKVLHCKVLCALLTRTRKYYVL